MAHSKAEAKIDGLRVLIVEDEMLVAMLLEDMLADVGCQVAGIASRLKKALQLVEQGGFDLAILDVNIDGQEIYPVAEQLASRSVPFVFATGYGEKGLREAYRDRPTLQKPFQEADLRRALGAAVAMKPA